VAQDRHAIQWGDSLREVIERGLRESNVIILLVTPDTVRYPNLFFEIGAAIGLEPLVAVVSQKLDSSLLPSFLRERKYLVQSTPEQTAGEFIAQG
jgi:hypothetical protein